MATPSIQDGVYYIQNSGSGTVVDLFDGSSNPGAKLQGYQKHELGNVWAPAQLWIITSDDEGLYTLQNANSRTFVELNSPENGTRMVCNPPNGKKSQQFKITRSSGGTYYVIQNVETQTYMDLYNGGAANNTPVNGWKGSGPTTENPNQLWLIVRA